MNILSVNSVSCNRIIKLHSGEKTNKTLYNSLDKDVFVKNTLNNNISFNGIIPQQELLNVSRRALNFAKKSNSSEKIELLAEKFFDRIIKILNKTTANSPEEQNLLRIFRHELVNSTYSRLMIGTNTMFRSEMAHLNNLQYLMYQKGQFGDVVKKIVDMSAHWSKIEKWGENPLEPATMDDFKQAIHTAISLLKEKSNNITILNENIIINKKVKKPFDTYNKVSQIVLNAVKYGENKPITIKYGQQLFKGKPLNFISVINEGTHPIANAEIDKILSGTGYRASHTRDTIKGTGLGFTEVIKALKSEGLEDWIPNLIEKNRSSGVKVTIPLNIAD
ncbi:MAG: ATP-binding protein [Candidatus Gastranaerophilales bacterium]|nr:ATP-binding protein [Candidatus Gastranaerophilales bacterium]